MALSVVPALRVAFPAARLIVVARGGAAEVFRGQAGVDEIITVPRGAALLADAWRRRREWRHAGAAPDVGILLTNSFATALWLFLTGAEKRIGYARDGRGWLLTSAVAPTPEILAAHQADYYFALLQELGITAPLTAPLMTLAPATLAQADSFLASKKLSAKSIAVLAPCSAFGAVKDWAIERYGAVARHLTQKFSLTVLLTGTAAQRETLDQIADVEAGIFNTAGEFPLPTLFALIARAKIFIGGDSGAAHLAAALRTPTVAIFGLTEISRTRPLGDPHKIALVGVGGAGTPNWRDPATHRAARAALDKIGVEEVIGAAEKLLDDA
jgi:lipopolysaccharide heptosyltransferase II